MLGSCIYPFSGRRLEFRDLYIIYLGMELHIAGLFSVSV